MKETAEDLETRELRRSLRARRPLTLAARALLTLSGWACFVGILVALVAESHPALERWVAGLVQDRIAGAMTRSVRVADVDVGPIGEAPRVAGRPSTSALSPVTGSDERTVNSTVTSVADVATGSSSGARISTM